MPKRQLNKQGGGRIRGVDPSKTYERQYGEIMETMVEMMSRIYRNQVLLELNKATVDKFADAQVGNYAAVFINLSKRAQRKLLKRFDEKRLKNLTNKVLRKVNSKNANQFYSRVENSVGISQKELMATEGLTFQINAMELETVQWAKKLRDETLEMYTANALRVMSQGRPMADVLTQFDGMVEKRKNHAKMVARTQVNTFNSLLGKARAQNLGLRKAVWQTADDERVRPCHHVRDGKEFDLDKGLYSSCDGKWLLPGVDYNCRCTYEYVIPEEAED